MAELVRDPAAESIRDGVDVDDGIVTLSGHVGSSAEKVLAESAAPQRRAHFDATSIDVPVDDGGVTLSGFVASLAERITMQHAAWDVPRVRNVVDNLIIG